MIPWAAAAVAAEWELADAAFGLPGTGEWTHEVEVADLDGDGHDDVVFVNGGGYSTPGRAESTRVFLHPDPAGPLVEAPTDWLGPPAHARTAKVRDFDGDGRADVFLAMAYGDASRLLLADGAGGWTPATLPVGTFSFGDAEPGDVDGDGDLDLVLADWGSGDALTNEGGPVVMWRNDGGGTFTDVTPSTMPGLLVGMSWDLELGDVDGDHDLDVMVSCKVCESSVLLANDGAGGFTDATARLPAAGNNYDFELLDLDGDGDLDAVTINDGPLLRESVWLNDGAGTFTDATATLLPNASNLLGKDDNVSCFVDADDDGDADWFIGSLSDPDRLLRWTGTAFELDDDVVSGARTPGTLGAAFADLDEDHRWDLVMAQGEVTTPEHVFRGVDAAVDTHPPVLSNVRRDADHLFVTIHDRKTPLAASDFAAVVVTDLGREPLFWAGGLEFRGVVPAGAAEWSICAADRAGNEACTAVEVLEPDEEPHSAHTGEPVPALAHSGAAHSGPDDAEPTKVDGGGGGGCGCAGAAPSPVGALLAALLLRRKRR
jgi:hypothetical protein